MPRTKRRRLGRRNWGPQHVRQLRHGHDFLNNAWGNAPSVHPDDLQPEWPDKSTLDDMRACWSALLAGEIDDPRGVATDPHSWARLMFEEGLSPHRAGIERGHRELAK